MKVFNYDDKIAEKIHQFSSRSASSIHIGEGTGSNHFYVLFFGANGVIGKHPTGFCQLFLVISGSGWIAGANGIKHPIKQGEIAFFDNGELHSKGSKTGMTALMIQSDNFDLDEPYK